MEALLTAENIFLLWREDKNDKKPGAHNPEKARYFKPKEKSGQAFPPPYLPPVFASLIFLLFFFARPDKCLSVHRPDGKKNISGIYGNTSVLHFLQGCLLTGCLNGGSCVFNEEKETFACACKGPWSGEKCELGKTVVLLLLAFLL